MKELLIYYDSNIWWGCGRAVIKECDEIQEVHYINRFYELTDDYFNILEVTGGSGIGYRSGKPTLMLKLDQFDKVQVVHHSHFKGGSDEVDPLFDELDKIRYGE